MKSQRTSALMMALSAALFTLGVGGVANAQGAPVYIGPGVPPFYGPPRYLRAEPLPDDVLLPQEIVGILRSTGFSPLSPPIRRGRFYVVAALHPDGEDGQVTIDAITGRFVRFVPAGAIGSMASYPPPPYAPPRRTGPRPPLPLPGVASRAPASTPVPAPRPQTQAGTANAGTTSAPAQASLAKTADNRTASAAPNPAATSADPVETKPSFGKPAGGPALLPLQAAPPAQGFE